MLVNADFGERVVILPEERNWSKSETPDAEQVLLESTGHISKRTTSIMRFGPNAIIPEHFHEGGEEIYVIEGAYSDDNGKYEAGSYVRSPSGSHHAPTTTEGCTIFIKMHQSDEEDRNQLAFDTKNALFIPTETADIRMMPLYIFGSESASLLKLMPGAQFQADSNWGGEEIFVLEGVFEDNYGQYPKGSWIRNPHNAPRFHASNEGCLIYVKTGHLPSQIDTGKKDLMEMTI